jgi:myo-inositol-1-phosphate synthase
MEQQPEKYGFRVSNEKPVDVVKVLKDSGADILINYLPVGSQEATEFYAQCAINAGVAFLNCIPVFIASDPNWEKKFIDAGLPIIGDDMKSQYGASIVSQILQELAFDRGAVVDMHNQLNVGGNSDFLNMTNQSRLAYKKISKENVIRAQYDIRNMPVGDETLFAGPSTWIPALKDQKTAYFNLKLRGFGDAPISFEATLKVQDSENSAGIVIDAIRYMMVAKELGICGSLRGPSAYTQKTPPQQMHYADSRAECEAFAKRDITALKARNTYAKG